MVKKVVLSVFAALALGCSLASAQGQRITGTVTDESGQPMIGAAVTVEGSSRGATTNVDGSYEIVAPSDATLKFSFLGYQSKTVRVDSRTHINIVLEPASEHLDEVIVTAFGESKKDAFTGSAKVIKTEDIAKTQSSSVANALVGKVAGLQTSSSSGSLGSEPTIRIRGFGSITAGQDPLWVIDGVPFDGDLNNINMNDIESVTVLKDAASNALYGARGANGVIMVTTRRAQAGDARVTFDAKWGVNSRAKQLYDYIDNPGEYYEMHYRSLYNYYYERSGKDALAAHQAANSTLTSTNDGGLGYNIYTVPAGQHLIGDNGKLNPAAKEGRVIHYKGQDYTLQSDDWMDELYHTSFRQEYNINVAGSTEKSNFFASLGYLDNDGIVDGSDMERWTARLRADYQAKKWLKVGANMSYTHFYWNGQATSEEGVGDGGDVFHTAANTAPIYPVYVRDGEGNIIYDKYGWKLYDTGDGSTIGEIRPNGYQINNLQAIWLDKSYSEGNAFGGNGFAEFTFIPGLKLTINGSVHVDETRATSVSNPYYGQFVPNGGIVSKAHSREISYNLQQLLNFSRAFGSEGNHHLDLLLGHEYYNTKTYGLQGAKSQIFSMDNDELNGAITDMSRAASQYSEYNNEGYFFRGQYDFDERIFFSASYRRDASSVFHPDNRWGNFWSLGAAWIISRESWFNAPWVNMLKVKASYGSQGNDNIGSFLYTDTFAIQSSASGAGLVQMTIGNKDITWETNSNFNVGVEFGFWHDRLSGSIDFFNRKTTDMLFAFPVSTQWGGGIASYYANIGDMVNRGIEVELNADLIRSRNVVWSFGLNMTHVKNKVVKLPSQRKTTTVDGHDGFISGSYFIGEGLSLYTMYMPTYAGVDHKDGNPLWYYTDANGVRQTTSTYSVASDSRELQKSAIPDLYGGFSTSVRAYGFDLSIAFDYQIGGWCYDSGYANYMSSPQGTSCGSNYHRDLANAWTLENPDSNIPRFQYNDLYTTSLSSRFLTKASYLNISNINLGYTLPQRITRKFAVEALRIYVSCDNVWYWSKRQGLDPRQSFNGATSLNYYAPIRTISGGISLTF